MHRATPTQVQRDALQKFEAAYRWWCDVADALAAAEARLWSETLRDPADGGLQARAREVLRLRAETRAAYAAMLPLMHECFG